MDLLSPAVITSKPAQKDFDRIKATHADLVQGMALQAQKVAAYRQQKAAELQQEQTMRADMDKSTMAANTNVQKNTLDFAAKQGELDIKRAALTA